MRKSRKNERGVALVVFGVMLFAFLAFTVVAIDLGRLAHTATEAQNIADASAHAGAYALAEDQDATAAALNVAGRYTFDGTPADAARVQIEVGTYDDEDRFTVGGDFPTAVRATASTTVHNIVAGVFGPASENSPVSRVGIAAICGKGSCDPETEICFPLCLGDCHFQALQECSLNQPDCLPSLNTVPSGVDNAGWTGWEGNTRDANSIRDFLPAGCPGSQDTPPSKSVGDSIPLNNGNINTVLQNIENCMSYLQNRDVVIPICACSGNFNQSSEIVGFATIHITGVKRTGCGAGGAGCGINIDTIVNKCEEGNCGGNGCGDVRFGTTDGIHILCDADSNQCG